MKSAANVYWLMNLSAYIDYCKDILESHVGQKQEQSSIDIHYTFLIQLLAKIDDSQQQRDYLFIYMHNYDL